MALTLPGAGRSTRPTICRNSPMLFVGRRQNGASDLGAVPTLGQNHAIRDNSGFAGRQSSESSIALVLRRVAVDVFGFDAGLEELVPEMDRVRHGDCEHYGRPVLSEPMPVADNVAHELVGIHTALKLSNHIVTGLGFYAAEIGIETLATRLRDEAVANDATLVSPLLVGAWARKG